MDWSHYCETLEVWISDQHKRFEEKKKQLQNVINERDRIFRAHCLALEKYQSEMQKFHLRASQNLSTLSTNQSTQNTNEPARDRFIRYTIPHPWRRVAAELIDSLVVLCIKLLLISFIKSESSFSDIFKYFGVNVLSSAPEYRTFRRARLWANSDYHRNTFPSSRFEKILHLLQNGIEDELELYDLDLLFLIDHLGRFVSALLEALLISYCFFGRGPGGATIGKWIMNLQVVSCDEVIPLPDMVEVAPGTNLGFARALVRSMLKGTSFLTIFSFFCMLFFQYHRCTYDIIAGTLVVQPIPPTPVNQAEQDGQNEAQPNVQ